MKIVAIFANKLFAIQYKNQQLNEYKRIIEYWSDPELVEAFLVDNQDDLPDGITIFKALHFIQEEIDLINDKIDEIINDPSKSLDQFFAPLNNNEYRERQLSQRKGKADVRRTKYLRLYAIRIEPNMYVITGGAIKLPLQHMMDEKSHTEKELKKLNKIKDYLNENGVFDDDSFYEFLIEQ
jgi:hypothetical protein